MSCSMPKQQDSSMMHHVEQVEYQISAEPTHRDVCREAPKLAFTKGGQNNLNTCTEQYNTIHCNSPAVNPT